MRMETKGVVRSVDRVLRILQAFSQEQPERSLTELAEMLDLSPSTVHRLLSTLKAHRFVEQDGAGEKYRLGLTLFKLGAVVQRSIDLCRLSEVPLRHLARRTEETAYLIVIDNDEALCLDRVEGHHQVRVLVLDLGGRLPLNCGGGPRALLAGLPDQEIERLLQEGKLRRMTPYSITEPQQVWADIALTRERGYSLSMQDVVEGVAAIGATVRDYTGQIVGAVSIAGILPHFDEARRADLVAAVLEEARAISRSLGSEGSPQKSTEAR